MGAQAPTPRNSIGGKGGGGGGGEGEREKEEEEEEEEEGAPLVLRLAPPLAASTPRPLHSLPAPSRYILVDRAVD